MTEDSNERTAELSVWMGGFGPELDVVACLKVACLKVACVVVDRSLTS